MLISNNKQNKQKLKKAKQRSLHFRVKSNKTKLKDKQNTSLCLIAIPNKTKQNLKKKQKNKKAVLEVCMLERGE